MDRLASQPKTLRDMISTVFIYRGTVLACTLLFAALAAVASLLERELWEASVVIWTQDQSPGLREASPYASEAQARLKQILTTVQQVLYSRPVLLAALARCGRLPAAVAEPAGLVSPQDAVSEPAPGSANGPASSQHKPDGDSAQSAANRVADVPADRIEAELSRLRSAIRLDAPKGYDFGSTPIFYMRVRDPDPDMALKLLRSLLAAFRSRFQALRTAQAKQLYEETNRQLAEARQAVREAEQALDRFVHQLGPERIWDLQAIESVGAGESELRKYLANVEQQLITLESQLTEREALLERVTASRADGVDPAALPAPFLQEHSGLVEMGKRLVEARAKLAELAASQTPQHAEYRAAADRLKNIEREYRQQFDRAVQALELEVAAKRAAVESLRRERDQRMELLAKVSGRYVEFARLKSELEQRRRIAEEAKRRQSAALNRLITAAGEVVFATLDGPRCSTKPVRPRRKLNTLIGLVLGLLTGLGLAFLRRNYSSTICTDSDLIGLDGSSDLFVASIPTFRASPIRRRQPAGSG